MQIVFRFLLCQNTSSTRNKKGALNLLSSQVPGQYLQIAHFSDDHNFSQYHASFNTELLLSFVHANILYLLCPFNWIWLFCQFYCQFPAVYFSLTNWNSDAINPNSSLRQHFRLLCIFYTEQGVFSAVLV